MNIEKTLEKIGFSPNEIKIYLALNDRGSNKAGKISKLARIDRSSCYNSLKSLLEKGLVSYVLVGNTKWFQATGPKLLLDYIKEQEESVKEILPELDARHKAEKIEGQVRLFKGIKGIKAIFFDIIRTGKDNFVFGDEGQMVKLMPDFYPQFDRMKKEKGIKTKLITKNPLLRLPELRPNETEFRFFENIEESPATTNIYGDRIAIIIWSDIPEGVILENKGAAKAYKSYFDILWNNAKRK
ncbi:hypothetical protein JXB27_04690 [Candidatus Woesearchaeota archaeon]|nr:hypothetical protein [Candidatus Woesearchaeota archaeon]